MDKQTLYEACELAALIAREEGSPASTPAVAEMVANLIKLAQQHKRLCEAECNTGLSPRQEKRREGIVKRMVGLLPGDFRLSIQQDPRGATVKLVLPSGRTNDWGQEGWCVPGS